MINLIIEVIGREMKEIAADTARRGIFRYRRRKIMAGIENWRFEIKDPLDAKNIIRRILIGEIGLPLLNVQENDNGAQPS